MQRGAGGSAAREPVVLQHEGDTIPLADFLRRLNRRIGSQVVLRLIEKQVQHVRDERISEDRALDTKHQGQIPVALLNKLFPPKLS